MNHKKDLKSKGDLSLIFCVFLWALLTFNSWAAPAISSVSGTPSTGETMTISGSDFGGKDQGAPVMKDDLETGHMDFTWNTFPNGTYDGLEANSDNNRHSGSLHNARHNFGDSWLDGGHHAYFSGGDPAKKYFVQYWFKLAPNWHWGTTGSTGDDASLANVKIFRMWNPGGIAENFAMATMGYAGGGIQASTEYVDQPTLHPSLNTSQISLDEWHCWQFEYAENTGPNAPDGEFRWWADGEIVLENTSINTSAENIANTSRWKRPFIIGFFNSWGRSEDPTYFYIDDVYIDSTWARVQIGNAQTFDACTHVETQIITNWTNSSVSFTMNSGSFQEGSTAYVFVTDDSGAVNATGHEITIGKTSSSITAWQIANTSFANRPCVLAANVQGGVEFNLYLPMAGAASLRVHDIAGREVWQNRIGLAASGFKRVGWQPIEEMTNGVYYVTLKQQQHQVSHSFVVNQ